MIWKMKTFLGSVILLSTFIQISLSGNAKSQLSLQCSLDLTENLVLKSLNPNLVAAKVSESVKNLINQESVKTKEVITVNTSLDLDTFSKLLPFLRCYFVNSPVNEENKLNVEDQASTMPPQKKHSKSTPIATESTQKYQQTSTTATNANTSNTTRLNKTTNPTYSTNADAPNTTRLNKTTDPTYSINAKVTPTFVPNQSTAEPKGSMEEKMTMVISICLTIFIAVALVCTGIVIYIWKRGFKFSSGSSTAVQLNIQSNAVVCTSNATTSNAAEEIEIANSTEENHVYDSVIYTGYQTFQPKTSDDLTEMINSNASSISDLSIQPETSESLTESIPTSIADQTFQPKTSESQTATVSQTSTCAADQTP